MFIFFSFKVSSLFKKRITLISSTVVTNRIWLKSRPNRLCDVLMTFKDDVDLDQLNILLDLILEAGLLVNINYHLTTKEICFYITATYER